MVFVAQLFHYPIKSCRGVSLAQSYLDAQGLCYDRRWMVVRAESGAFVTQRDFPRMAQIEARITPNETGTGETLMVHAPLMPLLQIPITTREKLKRTVSVWRFTGEAIDEGDDAARYFSDVLGTPCRLVQTPPDFSRRVSPEQGRASDRTSDRVGFADGYPLLVTSSASLVDLNRRLVAQNKPLISMERFRPNLVLVSDYEENALVPWEEDNWKSLRIGANNGDEREVAFRVATPCARCSVTTVDPYTGEPSGPEPLQTLQTFRREANGKVMFGMNLIHDMPDTTQENADPSLVRVGDLVQMTRRAIL